MALHTPDEHDDIRGISLCAGVGDLDLGLHLAQPGYRTVGYVERNSFAAAVLVARMADASLAPAPVWDDLKSFDGRPWRDRVHIVSAGYPCQPFTLSGLRKGEDDPRHLWPDVARIVDEIRPKRVFFENVAGHLSLGLHDVVRDLQALGYRVAACVLSAAEVGGSHIRERVYILADADVQKLREQGDLPGGGREAADAHRCASERQADRPSPDRASVADALGPAEGGGMERRALPLFPPMFGDLDRWRSILEGEASASAQPAVHRLDDGLADGLDRSPAAGNGVVPLAAARAYRYLNDVLS